jgi:hypothetical protein
MTNEISEPPGIDTALEQQHPRWWVWQSDTGLRWASVRENLTPSQVRAGCRSQLRADSADELALMLADQDQRAQDAS